MEKRMIIIMVGWTLLSIAIFGFLAHFLISTHIITESLTSALSIFVWGVAANASICTGVTIVAIITVIVEKVKQHKSNSEV